MTKFGIDVSKWNGKIDFNKMKKEGVEFVIIKAGSTLTGIDSNFKDNYNNAVEAGLGVGCYWYTYVVDTDEAIADANKYLSVIEGMVFDYPIYLDIEDKSLRNLSKDILTEIVNCYGTTIENAGYYFGVYSNVDWFRNVLDGTNLSKRFSWWIASWSKGRPVNIDAPMWQFGGSVNLIRDKKIGGILVDQNYSYVDFPSVIKEKGLNGYGNCVVKSQKYKTNGTMYVRQRPRLNGSYILIKDLPESLQKLCNSTILNSYAILKKGATFDVSETITDSDGRIWGKLEKGYVSLTGASGIVYCKKV